MFLYCSETSAALDSPQDTFPKMQLQKCSHFPQHTGEKDKSFIGTQASHIGQGEHMGNMLLQRLWAFFPATLTLSTEHRTLTQVWTWDYPGGQFLHPQNRESLTDTC